MSADLGDYVNPSSLRRLASAALEEDGADSDITSFTLIPENSQSTAVIKVGEPGVLCGVALAIECFRLRDSGCRVTELADDGRHVLPGDTVLEIKGLTRAVLEAERTALNFVQILSGIATSAARFVEAVSGLPTQILDTRKTHPLLRGLEKYAVATGGGRNHRLALSDAVLIKDNHLHAVGGIGAAVQKIRGMHGRKYKVEVEVDTLRQLDDALAADIDIILLDNMSVDEVAEAVRRCEGRKILEASGGINLENVRAYAETGVDRISIGALTLSSPALDFSMELVRTGGESGQ